MEVKFKWSPQFLRNVSRTFGVGGELQKWSDAIILESIHPYLPFDTGSLAASGWLHTVIGSGKLVWKTPYARYLYYGMLMVDPVYKVGAFYNKETGRFWSRPGIKKVQTNIPLKFRGGGKRGSHWAERWMADNLAAHEQNLLREGNRLLKR